MSDTDDTEQPETVAAESVPGPLPGRGPVAGLAMPSLGRYLRQVRESMPDSRARRPISRETAARRIGLSAAYLTQIEKDLRNPTPQALQLLATGYDLTPAQTRHIAELCAPPIPFPDTDTLRERLGDTTATGQHLDGLDRAGVIAAYFDPFWNLLAANAGMDRAFPGLEQIGNLTLWHFSDQARDHLPDWDDEAATTVRTLKAILGAHRRAAPGRALLAQLQHDPDFRQWWTRDIDITYHRDPATPLLIRDADGIRRLDIQTSTITDTSIRLLHGVQTAPARDEPSPHRKSRPATDFPRPRHRPR